MNTDGKAGRRVLIADPCADTVESTTWLLRLWGHDARGVETGRDVLEAARAYRPDTVLMEIALPGLDGCEAARRLRQQHGGPDVLLVAVTGYGDENSRRRSREAGFDWHLVKPVAPALLQSLLATNHQEAGGRE
jgi:two-component system CheB/CheR fusion protein